MFYLVYVSSAVGQFSKDQLLELLELSRVNNTSLGITGMLLYKDGNFMQILEGERDTVLALNGKISRDPRHTGILALLKGEAAERQFPAWTMGFRDLNSMVAPPDGFDDFMSTPLTGAEFSGDPTRAHKLLLTFKRSM